MYTDLHVSTLRRYDIYTIDNNAKAMGTYKFPLISSDLLPFIYITTH